MVSRRSARRATALLAAVAAVLLPGDARAQAPERSVEIVALPESEARAFFAGHPAAIGLGVFPESRDPLRFIEEIGYGAPHGGGISSGDEKPLRTADVVTSAHRVIFSAGEDSPVGRALRSAFPPTPLIRGLVLGPIPTLAVRALEREADLEQVIAYARLPTDYVVLGFGGHAPLFVGICRAPCHATGRSSGVLTGGIARRPAIVAPYDIAATVFDLFGIKKPGEGFIGNPLTSDPNPQALHYIEGLQRRLVRDAEVGSSPAVVTDAVTVAAFLVGLSLLVAGKRSLASRAAQGAWSTVAIGYLASLFIPSGRGEIRSMVVVVAFALGASFAPERRIRTARIFFAIAVAMALLFVIAPLNPGGEPGLSIWGNPLVSWRFFGMQNAQAASVAGGVVVWGVLAGLGAAALTVAAVLAAIVIGAPTIGANFVGVLTFTFGATLAVLALARRKVHLVQVVIAGAVAIGAFLLALLADVGSPVSHGGRAAKRISEGGISTAWDFVTGRLRLNVDLIRGFWGGVVWVPVFLVALIFLIAWGAWEERGTLRGRVAVWAGAAMALASMVLEDSGFYSGTTLLGAAAAGWIIVYAGLNEPNSLPSAGDG
jgi:hypothetical protein